MPPPIFDWDKQNIEHLARHQILAVETEQVILNRPVDLDSHLRNGEERTVQIGETDSGRILIVVSTMRDSKVRVVTAWPAKGTTAPIFSSSEEEWQCWKN